MPATVLVGTQWGDEGKGKICDLLAEDMAIIVRYQGGDNAGHTVVNHGVSLKLHHIPSGILYPNVTCAIGDGMVVNPRVLIQEMDNLESMGISTRNLVISSNAHLIMPYHLVLDREGELRLGKSKIGTTRKGIGPAYTDKAARIGIRVQDLLDPKIFREKLESALAEKNLILTKIYGLDPLDPEDILTEYAGYTERLRGHIADVSLLINRALDGGKSVLFEGAQGTLLDIDHGTYPYVTSSSPTAGGACIGAGVGPSRIDKAMGVAKAYVTRVGSGPFPTEEKGEIGKAMREIGVEYGTTTGRARRCGWLDAVILRYAVRINNLDSLALTKLDVLSQFDRLKICTRYEFRGETLEEFPSHQSIFHKVTPIYEEIKGWKTDIGSVTRYEDLPTEARKYIKRVEDLAGIPVEIISVGSRRDQTIRVPSRVPE
ncbi:MAG: adenylosuccinate synthase [Actinomycetota bacterium]